MSDPVIKAILAPLAVHYDPSEVIEVRMSQPQCLTIEVRGQGKCEIADEVLTLGRIERISHNLANRHGLRFDADQHPKVSCTLPGGHRFECLVGASAQGGVSLAIRCKHPFSASFSDFGLDAASAQVIEEYVRSGRHVLISGGTNTGKTTFLNLLLSLLPDSTRLVLAEDTPEIDYARFDDSSGLLASRGAQSPAMLSWQDLYDHINRITPDRVIFGEISTHNACCALSALNSGISGFMCTIHAESPKQVINRKFDQVMAFSGHAMPQLDQYLGELLDMVIQIRRGEGARYVSEIYLPKTGQYLMGEET